MVTLAQVGTAANIASTIGGMFGGGGTSRKRELDSYRLQSQAQRENIQPLKDAYVAAGFHPLLSVGQQAFTTGGAVVGDSPSLGDRMSQLGQGVSRAVSAHQNGEQRLFTEAAQKLQLENLQAQNDLLRAQTTRIAAPTTPPMHGANYSMDGQSGSMVQIIPKEIVTNTGDRERGISPGSKAIDYKNGHIVRVPSDAFQQGIEEGPANWLYQLMHTIPDMIRAEAIEKTRATRRLFTGKWKGG